MLSLQLLQQQLDIIRFGRKKDYLHVLTGRENTPFDSWILVWKGNVDDITSGKMELGCGTSEPAGTSRTTESATDSWWGRL